MPYANVFSNDLHCELCFLFCAIILHFIINYQKKKEKVSYADVFYFVILSEMLERKCYKSAKLDNFLFIFYTNGRLTFVNISMLLASLFALFPNKLFTLQE